MKSSRIRALTSAHPFGYKKESCLLTPNQNNLDEFTMALPNDDGLAWSPHTLSAPRPLAFVADTTECGDLLVVFQGSDCIFVLRKILRNDQSCEYTFLGPAFLWERSLDFVALASSASSIEEFVTV